MKHETADALSHPNISGQDTSPLADDILQLETDTRDSTDTPNNDDCNFFPQSFQPPTLTAFLHTQASDTYCRREHSQVGRNSSELNLNATPFRQRILFLPHHFQIAEHPFKSRTYYTRRSEYHWLHMAADVKRIVSKSQSCVQNNQKYHPKRKLQVLPGTELLRFVENCSTQLFPKPAKNNQYTLVVTNRYSRMTRAIPTSRSTSMRIANIFFTHWFARYGIPTYLLTNDGVQLAGKLSAKISTLLGIKHLTATTYCPHTDGRARR